MPSVNLDSSLAARKVSLAAGAPDTAYVEIARYFTSVTYDTRLKGASLDFGYGWSVDYQSVQLRRNMVTGLDWNVSNSFMSFQLCLRPGRNHKISITLPDGSMQRFTARNSPDCATGTVPAPNVVFDALPGTTSSLVAANVPTGWQCAEFCTRGRNTQWLTAQRSCRLREETLSR